jgi:hypothetical protein
MLLYQDNRISRNPRYVLARQRPKEFMHVPDVIRKCVVYVGFLSTNGEEDFRATAFFVMRMIPGVGQKFYLVTARHVIQGISKVKNFNGKVLLRMNLYDGTAKPIETDIDDWKFHEEDSALDVAVLPNMADLVNQTDHLGLGLDSFITEEEKTRYEIGIGDELFLTGLFYNHQGKARNIPIIRVGNIAAMPEEAIKTKIGFNKAYLVEARSIGGLSGSPVFVVLPTIYPKNVLMKGSGHRTREGYRFIGLMHGHYDSPLFEDEPTPDAYLKTDEVVNMGISMVIPSEKILEVLEQKMIRDMEIEEENEAVNELAPTMNFMSEPDTTFTGSDFNDALKRASRKTSEPVSEKKETLE